MRNFIKNPLISVITVVLNGEKTIEETIKSVVSQKYDSYEYIIIDGKSTDGTIEIIEKYKSSLSVFISEPDSGLYDAMNKAVSHARGQFIFFLGADDILTVSLDKIANWLTDIDTIYYGNVYRPKLGKIYDGEFSSYKLACRNICHQSIFYPKHLLERNFFDLKYRIFADYELNLRYYFILKIKFQYINETIAIFMDEGGTSHNVYDDKFEKRKLDILRKHKKIILYHSVHFRYILLFFIRKLGLLHFVVKIVQQAKRNKTIFSSRKKFHSRSNTDTEDDSKIELSNSRNTILQKKK